MTKSVRSKLGDKWHLDEVVVTILSGKHWLWRAVDQDGFVLDVLVQSRRNAKAAKRLIRKLLKAQGLAPRVMITDKLRSYGAAKQDIMPGVEHRSHKGLNNRAENSHQPIRRRERIMKRFKSSGSFSASFPSTIPSPTFFIFRATTFRPTIIDRCGRPPWISGTKSRASTLLHERHQNGANLGAQPPSLQCPSAGGGGDREDRGQIWSCGSIANPNRHSVLLTMPADDIAGPSRAT